jgi:hypothetical protein
VTLINENGVETDTPLSVTSIKEIKYDPATTAPSPAMFNSTKGGIDFNSSNLNLLIKRDGAGVPLPLALQDVASLSRIKGFFPVILEIKSARNLPIFSELTSSAGTLH